MVLPLLVFLVASTYAQHDHGLHVDRDFILSEIVHAGRMPWKTMIHNINTRKDELTKLKNKWNIDVENRAKGEKGYWEIWEKNYATTYQNLSDKFLI
jgi:hypothetical protein